MGKRHTPN